jgi:hypothetical protein
MAKKRILIFIFKVKLEYFYNNFSFEATGGAFVCDLVLRMLLERFWARYCRFGSSKEVMLQVLLGSLFLRNRLEGCSNLNF